MANTTGIRTPRSLGPINDTIRISGMEAGKLPPQAIDLEEAVLGAVMLEKDAIYSVVEILKPESFYKEAHGKIFRAIVDLFVREEPIDIMTVAQELRKKQQLEEVGGPFYITQLSTRVMSAAHAEFHARIIHQKYIQRELIRVSTDIQTKAFDESVDVDDLLNTSEQAMFEITQGNMKKEIQPINGLIREVIDEMGVASKREDSLSGVPSGYSALDRVTSGWQKSDLVIIAARPSMGKTAFILAMARNMAIDHNTPVAVFSLEMSSHQLVTRLIVSETEIESEKIRSGKLSSDEWNQLDDKIKALVDAPVFIDDTPAISVFEFRAKCRRLVKQHNIGIVMIDYLQLMSWTGDTRGNREQEVSNISRSLKAIAKELDIPIIALSQLNRGVEARTGLHNKRPVLSDLRESGAIEQDADLVVFIHRPEYYGFLDDGEGSSLRGIAEIIVAKHRNGRLADIQLRFHKHLAKFAELDSPVLGMYDDGVLSQSYGRNSSDGYQGGAPERNLPSKMNTPALSDNSLPDNDQFDNTPF